MSLQGSLDTIGLEDVFQLFALGRKSGVLRLRRGADPDTGREPEFAYVLFDMGDVVFATTEPEEDPFTSMRRYHRAIDDSAASEAVVREHIEEALARLLQWDDGDFFVDREDAVAHALLAQPYRFAAAEILESATGRRDRWKEILAVVPSTALTVRPVTQPLGSDDPVVLDRDEWSVLATATVVPDIDAVAVALGVSPFTVCSIVRGLVDRGLVQLAASVAGDAALSAVETPVKMPVELPIEEPVELPIEQAPVAEFSVPPASTTAVGESAAPDFPPSTDSGPDFESPTTFQVPSGEVPSGAAPQAAASTGDDDVQTSQSDVDATEPVAGADALDKSMILRLIAGVREN